MYNGVYGREKLPVAPRKAVTEKLSAVYDYGYDDGDRAVANLKFAPESAAAGGAQEVLESFRRI